MVQSVDQSRAEKKAAPRTARARQRDHVVQPRSPKRSRARTCLDGLHNAPATGFLRDLELGDLASPQSTSTTWIAVLHLSSSVADHEFRPAALATPPRHPCRLAQRQQQTILNFLAT